VSTTTQWVTPPLLDHHVQATTGAPVQPLSAPVPSLGAPMLPPGAPTIPPAAPTMPLGTSALPLFAPMIPPRVGLGQGLSIPEAIQGVDLLAATPMQPPPLIIPSAPAPLR
jgi:hypothetical protein